MFASSGVSLTRSTLCDIVKASAALLVPLVERMRAAVIESSLMWTDDTTVPMLIKGGTQRARFWTYIGDLQHSYDVYDFTINRSRDGPVKFLKGYSGYLHADAYGGYDGIYLDSDGSIIEVACWSHARRKFYDAKLSNPREAHQVLAWINQLFDIEDQARQMTSAERLALRCIHTGIATDQRLARPANATGAAQEQPGQSDHVRAEPMGRLMSLHRRRAFDD